MLRDDDKQAETAEKAHDPMTKENYFYPDAQKEVIHLAMLPWVSKHLKSLHDSARKMWIYNINLLNKLIHSFSWDYGSYNVLKQMSCVTASECEDKKIKK